MHVRMFTGGGGENGIPGACAILRTWQETHCVGLVFRDITFFSVSSGLNQLMFSRREDSDGQNF